MFFSCFTQGDYPLILPHPPGRNPFGLSFPVSDLSLRAVLLQKDFESTAVLDHGIVGSQGRDLQDQL